MSTFVYMISWPRVMSRLGLLGSGLYFEHNSVTVVMSSG
jgi:hypothetical protein